MITNDIQELLDGTLTDERMAEMLHTLSVSPEKRAAFRQHMALRGTMERDRTASALTSIEDAAIWGGIASAVQAPVTVPAGTAAVSHLAGWMGRAAALVIVGVAGYLLGTNQTTNIFNDGVAQPAVVASANTAGAQKQPQSNSAPGNTAIAQSVPEPAFASSTGNEKGELSESQKLSHPSLAHARTPRGGQVQTSSQLSDTHVQQPDTRTQQPESPNQQLESAKTVEQNNPSVSEPLVQATNPVLAEPEPDKLETTVPNDPALRQHPEQPVELMKPPVSSLYTSGLEVAFSERIGRITPIPTNLNEIDPDYSNRSIDVSYRVPTSLFGTNGSVGIGGRVTYGTFATVNLQSTLSINEEEIFGPVLEAKKGLALEFFANYRQPLTSWLALGVEGSYTGGSDYEKAGGDLFILGFVTDRIGIQAGGGYSQYWYNLADKREKIFSTHPNAGISRDAQDYYQGGLIQFRYGLLYRF
jgi:hypothetical protein